MKNKDPHWIEHSGIHAGGLHKSLGMPADKKIPAKMIARAANSDNPLEAKQGRLAETFRKMRP